MSSPQLLLDRLAELLQGYDALLVGGAVRDRLLGRAARDFDLVVPGDGERTARLLAERLPAKLIRLGGERFAALRLVAAEGELDIWGRGEASLEEELRRRDLTINAIAAHLGSLELVDPLGGADDLERRRLRACSRSSFEDDPLRVVRLARFAAELPGFEAETETLEAAKRAAPRVAATAAERRRVEFARLLEGDRPEDGLAVLLACSVPPFAADAALDGADPLVVATAFEHVRATASRFDEPPDAGVLYGAAAALALGGDVDRWFGEGWLTRKEVRKLALVLDAGPPPGTVPERRWWLHRLDDLWPEGICLASARAAVDRRSRPGDDEIDALVGLAIGEAETIFSPPSLVTATEVASELGLEMGPDLGVALRRLRRRQVEGRIRSRDEAIDWLVSERRSSGAG